jgi:ABC-type sugar transport system permease subunit
VTPQNRERWWTFQQRLAPLPLRRAVRRAVRGVHALPSVAQHRPEFLQGRRPRELRFVGIDNYRYLLMDKVFWAAVFNTTYFAVLFLTFQIPLSLILADSAEQQTAAAAQRLPLRVLLPAPGRLGLRRGDLPDAAGAAARVDQQVHRHGDSADRARK